MPNRGKMILDEVGQAYMTGKMILDEVGQAYMTGVDHGGTATVLQRSERYLVVKWPGHNAWVSIGSQEYQPPIIAVYIIEGPSEFELGTGGSKVGKITKESVPVMGLIQWENKRGKLPLAPTWVGKTPEEHGEGPW